MKPILPAVLLLLAAIPGIAAATPTRLLPQDPPPMPSPTQVPAQKITTFLWFDRNAEEAIRFYTSIFPDSKVLATTRWGPGGPVPAGTLMSATFTLAGQQFMALNGGPAHRLSPAVSLYVSCADQAEIDATWDQLLAGGGKPARCGWLEDRFGLSWQVVPQALGAMLQDPDPARVQRVTAAFLAMVKFDVAALQRAYDGR